MTMNEGGMTPKSLTNLSTPLFSMIERYVCGVNGHLFVIVPFITNSTLELLLSRFNGSEVTIVTSWRPDHLKTGVSSLDLYPLSKKNGWSLYINAHIHAKIYSDSLKTCIVTSANCTNAALCDIDGNIESVFFIDKLTRDQRIELQQIVFESIRVNDHVYDYYLNNIILDEDVEYIDSFLDYSQESLYLNSLPQAHSPQDLWNYLSDVDIDLNETIEHDLALFCPNYLNIGDKESFFQIVSKNFLDNAFIKIIEPEIDYDGLRFGQIKMIVRNNSVDDPKPDKDILTKYVQNIYQWFIELFPEKYRIYVPYRHSQFLARR